ncbi:signal peptidase II [Deinococcus arcticus]|uniref:Lipoprotein signal peptidase n=1 Tax=Deinococcus arcticus TaxID=2136176 RepID=A0A2T3W6U4_9DEIO|nr:signal peptidase II [Deinococcus arcticus]PTA67621.1 signal peptidase II [Deinococcus arcticus]
MLRGVPTLTDRSRRTPLWLPLLVAALLVAADQALKAWALASLQPDGSVRPFLPGLLDWQLTFNTGAAWSLFSGSAVPLAVGRMAVGLGLLVYVVLRPQPRLLSVVLSMIAAGAIGNAIDGLRQGKVTDMLHSPLLSSVTQALYGGSFPIFNIADICVVTGTLILIVLSLLGERRARASV